MAVAVAAAIPPVAQAGLAAVEMAATRVAVARMVLAVVAVAPVTRVAAPPAESAGPAAWRFNMPTKTMRPPET